MKSAKPIAVALTLLLTGVFASTAGARTLHASGGGVSAKLTFTVNHKTDTVSTPRLALTQSGVAGYSASVQERKCGSGYCSEPTLNVANLDGAHDPVVSLFTGGAHCCTLARVYAQSSSGRWRHVDHDFADPSFRLEDLGHNGQQEFVTANDAFAYLLTDYADSGMPLDVAGPARRGALVEALPGRQKRRPDRDHRPLGGRRGQPRESEHGRDEARSPGRERAAHRQAGADAPALPDEVRIYAMIV
jgi:hypothetical protein